MKSPQDDDQPPQLPDRLTFLDGLRGLSCLYVVLFHASTFKFEGSTTLSPVLSMLATWLSKGYYAVVFFIVLSGFSLMMPLARHDTHQLYGGKRRFFYRRSRRILPPYYAALVFSLAPIIAINALGPRLNLGPPLKEAVEPGSIVSHLLLFHNLNFDWVYRINGPMWSVATEWHIYFIFAFLLLPLQRYAGYITLLVVTWVLGSLPFFLLPLNESYFWAAPWFVGSFSFGMLGAAISFSPRFEGSWLRTRAPWGLIGVVCFVLIAGMVGFGADSWVPYPVGDFLVSVFAFCWINAGVQQLRKRPSRPGLALRLLSSKSLVYLGGFSYSLYLVQHPLFRFAEKVVEKLRVSYDAAMLIQLLAVLPLVMVVAWFFSEFFERPFMRGGVVLPALRRWWTALASSGRRVAAGGAERQAQSRYKRSGDTTSGPAASDATPPARAQASDPGPGSGPVPATCAR